MPQNIKLFKRLKKVPSIVKLSGVNLPGGYCLKRGYIGMCRCEGYGFQEVYPRIGFFLNQNNWV